MKECGCGCKCNTGEKSGNKDLIVGQLKAEIKKLIQQSLEEMKLDEISGTGGVAGFSSPFAFGNAGEKIATRSLPGFTVAKKNKKVSKI